MPLDMVLQQIDCMRIDLALRVEQTTFFESTSAIVMVGTADTTFGRPGAQMMELVLVLVKVIVLCIC